MLIKFLLAVILCELLTELVVKSEIFKPIIDVFTSRRNKNWFFWYIGGLLDCGYCFSVYAGVFVSFLLNLNLISYPLIDNNYLGIVVTGLIVHRVSNIVHNCIDKYTNKYYDLRYRISEDIIIEGDKNE